MKNQISYKILMIILVFFITISFSSGIIPVKGQEGDHVSFLPLVLKNTPRKPFEGFSVEFWHVYSGGPGEALDGLIDEFNQTNPYGITVNGFYQGSYAEVQNKVDAGIISGDMPDVVMAYTNVIVDWYFDGYIADLTSNIGDPDYGLTQEELEDIYPHVREAGKMPDGAWIAYPMTQSANVLVYNFTWAEEMEFLEAPQTSAQLREQVCAAAEANNLIGGEFAGTGGLLYIPNATNWLHFLYAFSGDELNEGSTAYDFNSPEAISATLFLNDMKAEGCVWQAEESYPNLEQAQRKALVTMSSTAGLPFYEAAFAEAENTDEWGFIAAPGPDGLKAVDAFQQMLGILPSTDDQQLASWLFIKWLTSPEIQNRWVRASGYFGTQYSTEDLLADYMDENPIWATGVELLTLGPSEPQTFPAWSSVRNEINNTAPELFDAADQAVVENLLETLTTTANALIP
jgi:multiple sugar transport system substrate-binding protein/sn-glycerol 3-phosphate transport system substrate-binding protein